MPESVIINFMYQHCFLRNRINLLTVLISFLQSHFLPFLSRVNIIMCSHSTWVLPAVKFVYLFIYFLLNTIAKTTQIIIPMA